MFPDDQVTQNCGKEIVMSENVTDYDGDDAEDVQAALERQTDDGKGDDEPGESDFQGFATEGVENDDESNDENGDQA